MVYFDSFGINFYDRVTNFELTIPWIPVIGAALIVVLGVGVAIAHRSND